MSQSRNSAAMCSHDTQSANHAALCILLKHQITRPITGYEDVCYYNGEQLLHDTIIINKKLIHKKLIATHQILIVP